MASTGLLLPAVVIGVGTVLVYLTFFKLRPKTALDKKEWRKFPLVKKTVLSHNTAIYRFKLQSPTTRLGLPIGQHISIVANVAGKEVTRSYTPVSSDSDLGYVDLLVKSYPQGNVSKVIGELKVGDEIRMRGPKGNFLYTPNCCATIGMIAGGTGITPMYQIIKAIVENPKDKTQVSLIFANVTEQDILLKDELDKVAAAHADQFKVYYVLNTPPENWTGGVGFVTKEMIESRLFKYSGPEAKVLICGPPPMVKAMTGYCEDLGFPKAETISKMHNAIFKF